MRNRGLGRGLSFLLQEAVAPIENSNQQVYLDINLITPNEDQPRKYFDSDKIQELVDSINIHGVIQPIIVTSCDDGHYKIIAGERRYRASKIAGLKSIPAIIKTLDKREILAVSLIENIQRQELTAIEEAECFQKLINDFGYSQHELATVVSKSRSHIANLLRLNQLPPAVKTMVNSGQLSMGHARCLIGLEDAETIANEVIANDFNVRETEELVNKQKRKNAPNKQAMSITVDDQSERPINEDLIILSNSLSEKFSTKVTIENTHKGGKLTVYYSTLEELDTILEKL